MREIEFRIYDKELEKMIYLDDEDYDYRPPLVFRLDQVFRKDSQYNDYEDFEWNDISDRVEIMQYTGLKDKNEKKIFEGDIVLYKDWTYEDGESDSYINKGVIEYNESNCCFNVTERNTVDIADVLYEDNEDLEIIGNIWDNPDLLKEEL